MAKCYIIPVIFYGQGHGTEKGLAVLMIPALDYEKTNAYVEKKFVSAPNSSDRDIKLDFKKIAEVVLLLFSHFTSSPVKIQLPESTRVLESRESVHILHCSSKYNAYPQSMQCHSHDTPEPKTPIKSTLSYLSISATIPSTSPAALPL